MPFAFAGAVAAGPLSSNVQALRLVYAILMLSIATYLARTPSVEALSEEECIATGTQLLAAPHQNNRRRSNSSSLFNIGRERRHQAQHQQHKQRKRCESGSKRRSVVDPR